ncbi:30S ribosomal protein S14 [Rickettsia prowazekii]|uniref:Small ribosomal subunit protein uS14 n=2 Tax=Rickettsia prowazekii TaxID=782 RepID=RS14_RICPR|nr:30S ribosomal protein S14 [Rickettsia prowazekii]Q9ZCR8.1 RecName: Full=Small ribosomal subunit protein uS14; AltName: Full=30S ribosomal protein S14 [Rickettsia prowazekii str. Madrid E]EOB10626.1 30S ribosomal protein S14 [Rickettsia prowazekii str. GvF12]ADE30189.1 30S ribosomal protein S14 [Rickettsia prowazekii str. Rp22]AFE49446.1 30S ribosomal protein S14 [Rickettsia prowazekii str. Chernikova]AFE50290.1 30S ribosomal protein S14 [Rickettsia prowazekii str. Katsinyian]AFE51136.1 30S
MAKVSSIQKNKSRQKKSQSLHNKRSELKSKIYDKSLSLEQRFPLIIALAQLPRNSSSTRIRNRCELTGRPRGVIRKFGISRNKLRELIGRGLVPGVVKASW